MQNRFYDPPAVGHIYTLLPTRGLIYATTDLAKPTQGTTFTFPTHRRSALAPIVNGLSTDVKLLFLPPDFLFIIRWQQRVVSASIQQWQEFGMGLREMPSNPIQSDSILSPIQKY